MPMPMARIAFGLAADLVALKVDLIVAVAGPAVFTRDATSTIPIVFVVYSDPVRLGLVTSLARPGGNLTGLTSIGTELIAKRLQLHQGCRPGDFARRGSRNPLHPWANLETARANAAAQSLGLRLQRVEVGDPTKFERAFSGMAKDRAAALVVNNDPLFSYHRKELADLALKHHLPTISDLREHVEAGGLMAYTVHDPDLYRRAATYVDKILKGAKHADLPIEQPTTLELVVNLRTAKVLGLTIPPAVLARADEIIQMTPPTWLDAQGRRRPALACWTCGREVAPMRFRADDLRRQGWAPPQTLQIPDWCGCSTEYLPVPAATAGGRSCRSGSPRRP